MDTLVEKKRIKFDISSRCHHDLIYPQKLTHYIRGLHSILPKKLH
jgi:hypothetical protein